MNKILIKPKGLFNPVYVPHIKNDRATQIFYGGSSSGKSVFIADRTVLDVLSGRNYLIVRNVEKTLRKSCWNEIVKSISKLKLTDYFKISKAEMTITAVNNDCQIMFAGLDDVEKIKSITPRTGVLTDIWIEEATETEYDDYKQLTKRLRGFSDHPKRVILTFNPIYKTHWIYAEFFGIWDDTKTYAENESLSILKTTHRDNQFLTQSDHDALESEKDPYYRDVYTLGNWGVLGDIIFRNWEVADLSEMKIHFDNIRNGGDFGFSSDPATCTKLHFDRKHKIIYIFEEIYQRGLTNSMLADEIRPIVGTQDVFFDCSEPKSIAELRSYGINAKPCIKGQDSVIFGIQFLQGCKIFIDRKCQQTKNEFALYQWKQDKDGNSLRQPQDKNNHLIDAIRYALSYDMIERKPNIARMY